MPELDLRRLRPQTQTVSVYTRHLSGCSKAGEPQWRRCRCAKYLYLKDGTRKTVSAKTRSWEKAEAKAQEIRDAWDPVKQKMRELDEQKQAQLAQEVSIEMALERWLKSISADIENQYTQKKISDGSPQDLVLGAIQETGFAFRSNDGCAGRVEDAMASEGKTSR